MDTTLEKTRFVVQHYGSLQGLVVVPGGVAVVLISLARQLGWLPPGDQSLPLLAVLIAGLIGVAIWIYYTRRLGRVRAATGNSMKWLFLVICLVVLFAFGQSLAVDLKRTAAWTPSFTLLVLAVWFVTIPLFSEGKRRYYYAIGATVGVLGLLPLLGVSRTALLGEDGNWAIALWGTGLTIGGLLDHRFLKRLLREVREVTVEASC